MNINASIVDQRIAGIVEENEALLPDGSNQEIKKSAGFVLLSMSTSLDITLDFLIFTSKLCNSRRFFSLEISIDLPIISRSARKRLSQSVAIYPDRRMRVIPFR